MICWPWLKLDSQLELVLYSEFGNGRSNVQNENVKTTFIALFLLPPKFVGQISFRIVKF